MGILGIGKKADKVLSLAKSATEIIDKSVTDKDEANRLKAQVIIADATGESKIQREWRPRLMHIIMFFLIFCGVVNPVVFFFSGKWIPVKEGLAAIPDPMWQLLLGSAIVCIGGRSVEKSLKGWKNK